MKRGKRQKTRYLHWRIASLLGLDLGTTIGRLDPTTRPVVESVYQPKEGDELHRRFTVVDAYSAAVDLLDLKRGGVNVVFQAISAEELFYPDPSAAPAQYQGIWKDLFQGPEIVERVKQGIDEHLLFARRYSRYIEVAQSAAEVRRAVERGRIALVLMLKSGWINDDLTVLQQYHQWGIRVMALCHLAALNWADSSSVLNQKTGLSDFGRQVVRTCNELGMLVDLSHASDQTCWDALEVCSGPLIATHSKCRALSDSERDLPDELIKAIAATGGVVGILAPAPRPGPEARQARLDRDRRLREQFPDPFDLAAAKLTDAEVWNTKLDLENINRAVDLAGIDHVALSSHFQNVPQWREFTGALLQHGYSKEDAEKILGGNALRVFEQTVG